MRLNDHRQTSAGIVGTLLPMILIGITAIAMVITVAMELHNAIDNVVSHLVH